MRRFLMGLLALLVMVSGGARAADDGCIVEAGTPWMGEACTASPECYPDPGGNCQKFECGGGIPDMVCCDGDIPGLPSGQMACYAPSAPGVQWHVPIPDDGTTPTPAPQPEPPKGGGLLQEFSDWVGSWFDRHQPDERPRGGWVLSDFEPPSDETPTFPPDPNPFPECPEGEPWVCPKGQPIPEGCMCVSWPDGRQTPEHGDNGGLVLVDLWPEWQTRQASKLVDGGGNIEWISPRESRPPFTVADLFHAWGMYDTEDGTDDTPTLDDPTERDGYVEHNPLGTEYRGVALIEVPPLVWYEPAQPPTPEPTPSETPTAAPVEPTPAVCPPGTTPMLGGILCLDYWTPGGDWRVDWSVEPDLSPESSPCVVEVIDQPVSVEYPDGSSAAYLGGCEVETCPGAKPVTTCCTGESLTGHVVCQTVDPAADLYPYEPPATIWDALEWLLTLPGSGEIPAGYEGPWRLYLYTSATEGR